MGGEACIVSCGRCSKLLQTGCLKTMKIHLHRSGVEEVTVKGNVSYRGPEKHSFLFPSTSSGCWCSSTCGCTMPISAFIFTWLSSLCVSDLPPASFLIRTPTSGFMVHPDNLAQMAKSACVMPRILENLPMTTRGSWYPMQKQESFTPPSLSWSSRHRHSGYGEPRVLGYTAYMRISGKG